MVENPVAELARRLETDDRYVYRWRNGLDGDDKPTLLIRFLTVAEILHTAGVPFESMYPCWCSACGKHKNCGGTGLCWTCYAESGSTTGGPTGRSR